MVLWRFQLPTYEEIPCIYFLLTVVASGVSDYLYWLGPTNMGTETDCMLRNSKSRTTMSKKPIIPTFLQTFSSSGMTRVALLNVAIQSHSSLPLNLCWTKNGGSLGSPSNTGGINGNRCKGSGCSSPIPQYRLAWNYVMFREDWIANRKGFSRCRKKWNFLTRLSYLSLIKFQ
jgi:hypothetical protein